MFGLSASGQSAIISGTVIIRRPTQNVHRFQDVIFKYIFLNEMHFKQNFIQKCSFQLASISADNILASNRRLAIDWRHDGLDSDSDKFY